MLTGIQARYKSHCGFKFSAISGHFVADTLYLFGAKFVFFYGTRLPLKDRRLLFGLALFLVVRLEFIFLVKAEAHSRRHNFNSYTGAACLHGSVEYRFAKARANV